MLRELFARQQTDSTKPRQQQKNAPITIFKPSERSESPTPLDTEDEDFVPISHRDAGVYGMSNDFHEDEPQNSPPGAKLSRMSGNLLDLDDDAEHAFLHPLMGHLQGRLLGRNAARNTPSKFAPLHPYAQVLLLSDVDECLRVEEDAFPENERCSREKVCQSSFDAC